MTITELGAIGELVGGVAVIGSLIFVGLQVRHGNALNRAESVRSFARDYNSFLMQVKEPDFVDVFRRGIRDFESLSPKDQTRLHLVLFNHFMLGFADSMIDPKRIGPFAPFLDVAFAAITRAPGFLPWWHRVRGTFEGLGPDYYARLGKTEAPDLLEFAPWFAYDESEREGA